MLVDRSFGWLVGLSLNPKRAESYTHNAPLGTIVYISSHYRAKLSYLEAEGFENSEELRRGNRKGSMLKVGAEVLPL